MIAASPEARTNWDSVPNTRSAVWTSRLPVGSSAKNQARRIGDRTRNGNPLLFATRQFSRPMGQTILKSEVAQQLGGAIARLHARQPADHLRQHHVLQGGEFRQQMMELIDEADIVAPDLGALDVGQLRGRHGVNINLAGIGMLKQARDMQKRRFSRSRRSDQRHRLSSPYRKLGALEDVKRQIALMKLPANTVQEDERMLFFFFFGRRRGRFGYRGFIVHRG